ncbi:MAG: DUF2905 domain-containing protein [Nitrospinota bacterium]
MEALGRLLVMVGVGITVLGALIWLGGRVPWLGRLPGDIVIQRGGWTFYFPLATMVLLSVLLTLLLNLFRR